VLVLVLVLVLAVVLVLVVVEEAGRWPSCGLRRGTSRARPGGGGC